MLFKKLFMHLVIICTLYVPLYPSTPSLRSQHSCFNFSKPIKILPSVGCAIIGIGLMWCIIKHFNYKITHTLLKKNNKLKTKISSSITVANNVQTNPLVNYDPFLVMPHEIIIEIYRYCDADTLRNCASVCKKFNNLYSENKYVLFPIIRFYEIKDILCTQAFSYRKQNRDGFSSKTLSVTLDVNSRLFDVQSGKFAIYITAHTQEEKYDTAHTQEEKYDQYKIFGELVYGTYNPSNVNIEDILWKRGNYIINFDVLYAVNSNATQLVIARRECGGSICDGAEWNQLDFTDIVAGKEYSYTFNWIFNDISYKSIHFINDVVALECEEKSSEKTPITLQLRGLGNNDLYIYTNSEKIKKKITDRSFTANSYNLFQKKNEKRIALSIEMQSQPLCAIPTPSQYSFFTRRSIKVQ